jgi:tetraacyldisaccharide 4'-kinase
MKAPEFWSRGQGGLLAVLLSPIGLLYAAAGKLRRSFSTPWQSPVPVICVGNVVVGGAGKTPVALDIAGRLSGGGKSVSFLSRGYGGSEPGPHLVDTTVDQPSRVGDEPLLLSRIAPTWISRERVCGAKVAGADADIIIMDDGFQNPSIQKTCSLLVIDGTYGVGNGRCMPSGPLREPLSSALGRTDAVIIIGDDRAGIAVFIPNDVVVLRASVIPGPELETFITKPIIAFAGIGQPQKFFDTLKNGGCSLTSSHAFADHHAYTSAEITRLKEEAERTGSRLVTTEKDLVRIAQDQRDGIDVLTITLQWEDTEALNGLLNKVPQV